MCPTSGAVQAVRQTWERHLARQVGLGDLDGAQHLHAGAAGSPLLSSPGLAAFTEGVTVTRREAGP